MAAREGLPRGARLPRCRERLHRGADRTPRRPAHPDLRGDQDPHPGDRPVRAGTPARLLVLRPLLRGPRVRRQLPGPGRRPRRLDAAPARGGQRPRPAGASRRGGAARPQRARGGPRVLQPRGVQRQPGHHAAGLLHRRRRRRALHRAGQGPRQRQAARRRDRRRPRRRHLGPQRPRVLLQHRRRDLAARQDLAAPARHRAGRRRARAPRAGRQVLARRRPQPHRAVPGDRGRLEDHLGVPRPRHRASRARVPLLRRAGRGRRVLARARGARRARPVPGDAQRERSGLRARRSRRSSRPRARGGSR